MSITIVAVSGSLRRDSFNTRLLKAAQGLMPEGATLNLHTIDGIPLYNFDDEESAGIPQAVSRLKDAIAKADGLLISTPEYNNSIPGVLKNAIDWLSRPPADIPRVFAGRPVAIMGATPGVFGTTLAQTAWLPVMRTLGVNLWTGGRLLAPRAAALFDDNGELSDEGMQQRLQSFLAGFIDYIDRVRPGPTPP